ncbi:AAA family ATPase [Ruegeria lacuscaerulensis]|uniref:AAA family ATPase n=1 Tax=Ruegeria lacuscaerulensis TaxID=55218 RepID=UPI00147E02D5|nr:AAA family ATPase [Ruegeria lacuscaerulensis]
MTFINADKIAIAKQLKSAHFDLPRGEALRSAFQRCFEERYLSQEIEGLEARGLVITGESRVGKSRELKRLISEFNSSQTKMPDGRPAKIVSCLLSGRVSFKDLGIKTLHALGYELKRNQTQQYIWDLVLHQAEGQGVIGIHYDECQHVFSKGAKSNRLFLDSFKSMMKEPRWPMMLILSGVPTLSKYVGSYEQLNKLVDPVHFPDINLRQDEKQLVSLLFAYADQVEIEIEALITDGFLERLLYACVNRWGLVIELLIDTLIEAKLRGKASLSKRDFVEQFALRTGTSPKYSPFTVSDFEKAFNPQKLLEINA